MSQEIKVPIQLPRYLVRRSKKDAIAILRNHVKTHPANFIDNEEIVLRYIGNNNEIVSVNAIIENVQEGIISFELEESDTVKIVEQQDEPEDKDVLWLTDSDPIHPEGNIRDELDSLKKRLKELQDIVSQHEYSFNNALSGGNIKKNDTKYSLANLAAQEEPEHSQTIDYATEETAITSIKIYVGKYELEPADTLYAKQRYFLNLKAYNVYDEPVSLDDCTIIYDLDPETAAYIGPEDSLYCEEDGTAVLSARVIDPEGNMTSSDTYDITFTDEEEPAYYNEPTYHQFIVKNAKNFEELSKYIDNLGIGEFCWCIAENTLYFRAEAANHTIQLFKINGQSGPAPVPETVSFEIDENGILIIESENAGVSLDENGILHLLGDIDENGVLHLNNM